MTDDPLHSDVQFLRGAGPQRAELLHNLGIETVGDLLWHLPRDVLDLTRVRKPRELVADELQSVRGRLADIDAKSLPRGRVMTSALLECEREYVRGVWFNQPWMKQKLEAAGELVFSGKPQRKLGRWEFVHPHVQWLETDDDAGAGILARYPLTEGLKQHHLRKMMAGAIEQVADQLTDPLPAAFRDQLSLPALSVAIRNVHQPASIADYEAARRRLIFGELFELQVLIHLRSRSRRDLGDVPHIPCPRKVDARIRRLFPFELTKGQIRAIGEIVADLASGTPMHRLLQAEVGAGKTAVALYAMLTAVAAGYQAVLMAPTELLAVQHWETVDELLGGSRVKTCLLTGRIKPAERRRLLDAIAAGEIELVVGTHAVIQDDVQFARLGLAIIDEQHRFGVTQRAKFSRSAAHVLVMTATPIPRSLYLTQFGDLDLTIVRDLPAGRQPVVTARVEGRDEQAKVWQFLREQLRAGRQLYVVCPRIETAGEAARDAAAEEVHQYLARTELRDVRLELLHGRFEQQQRDEVMRGFRDGEVQALVSTTVIEVGINVPNATLMVVLHAERYGLSQLHQLRGRIARGSYQGYCFLFSDSTSDDAVARLTVLESSSDGFFIAERDFELRGPGEMLGTRQHGRVAFRVADPARDEALHDQAREQARNLIETGAIDEPNWQPFLRDLQRKFGKSWDQPESG